MCSFFPESSRDNGYFSAALKLWFFGSISASVVNEVSTNKEATEFYGSRQPEQELEDHVQ
jgi:hypothetical protein